MSSAPSAKFFVEKEVCERASKSLCPQFPGQTPKKKSQRGELVTVIQWLIAIAATLVTNLHSRRERLVC